MAEYIARVSNKAGNALHKTGVHPSREAAATAAYEARPNARSVSTSIAHNGVESHRDIRWHNNKADYVKETIAEGEIVSSQLRTKGRENLRRSKIREGLAYLIEDVMAKSEVVMAAQSIADKLQDMAEDLSTVEAKDIMPMSDSMTSAFGPPVADQFNSVATDQVRQLISTIQSSKSAIDQEIQRMKQGVNGGDTSDMGMDNAMMPPESPDMAAQGSVPPPSSLPEVPSEPGMSGDMDDMGDEAGAIEGGFAGRDKKESAKPRGKKLAEHEVTEDFLGSGGASGGSPPAIDQHPHKSVDFATNLHNLGRFHGQAAKLARNIEAMIDTDSLSGNERKSLANVLSNFAGFAHEPSLWSDAETKLKMSLQAAGLWDTSKPEVNKIVTQLRKLAHLIAFKHEGMIESSIRELKMSSDPDALIFGVFRKKLAETRDAQTAAIHAARSYAIDIEDVVSIVREAATNRDRYGEKARSDKSKEPVNEFDMNTPASAKGMFKGKTTGELEKRVASDKAKVASAHKNDKGHAAASKDLKRSEFAVRAHKSKNDGGWHHSVNEDEMIQNASLFPVQSGPNTTPNPPLSNPGPSAQSTAPIGGPNANPSTNKPMTPNDMRMRQQTQTNGQQAATAMNTPPPPTGGKPMAPPSETDQDAPIPNQARTRMAPTNQVRRQQQQ